MNELRLDHVILVVSDLQVASRQFSQLGFTVLPGGVHSGGLTHNSLVPFPDGTYLELLSTTRPSRLALLRLLRRSRLLRFYSADDSAIDRRLAIDLAGGIGMADFCMASADLETELLNLESRGGAFSKPIPGGRIRPDGQEIAWRTSVPRSLDLPFLIDDQTPRELRVPAVEADFHENGILGMRGLAVLVPDLVKSMARYRRMLNDDPVSQSQFPQPQSQSSEFHFAGQFISLISPLPDNSVIRRSFKSRSARPAGIFFNTLENGTREPLCLTYLPEEGATLSRTRILFTSGSHQPA